MYMFGFVAMHFKYKRSEKAINCIIMSPYTKKYVNPPKFLHGT